MGTFLRGDKIQENSIKYNALSDDAKVFEKGDVENSATLKGGNNQVISEGGVALGKNNFVGLKGWYINNFNSSTVHISNQNTELGEYIEDDNFNNPYEVGDIISIQIGSIFTNIGHIEYIKGNYMLFTPLRYFSVPQSDPEKRYYLWVLSKPNAGVVDLGQNAISYGLNNQSLSECAYAEGKNNKAFGKYAHVEGKENEAHYCSHVEGSNNIALGNTSHAEGTDNRALNSNTHVEGRYTSARGYASHAEGYGESVEVSTEASGEGAHAEGGVTKAQGNYSHTEGQYTSAVGIASHAEGKGESVANPNLASGNYSHVEGEKTKATNIAAHAEGIITTSSGKAAHAEGRETQALADYSHAEGYLSSVVSGAIGGHSEGVYTIANNTAEHASGKYNVSIPKTADNTTAEATHFSIGIGTSDDDRKNAFEVKQNGDIYIKDVEGRIQDKLNGGSSATPDWNAQPGDAGYIKNKPFYNNVDYVINKGGEYKNVHNESNVIFNNKTLFNLGDIAYGAVITINSGPPVTLEKRYESDGTTTLIINDISNYLSTYPIKIGNLVTISEIFIPDTIARKSDLENIGGNDSSSVTPDWNAQQGEAGYIENKPAFVEKLQTYDIVWSYDTTEAPTITEDLPTEIHMDNVMHFIAKNQSIYPDLYFSVKINQDYTTISGRGINTFKIKIQNGDIYVVPMIRGTQKITALKVVDLNESSLNNNVITTFKQELTEGNKNQALTNLGIDPVVWKYMCEPYHLSYQNKIPDDLRSVIFDENDELKDIVLKLVVFEINDDNGHSIYPAARLSGDRRAVMPGDDYINYAVLIYPDGTTSDW